MTHEHVWYYTYEDDDSVTFSGQCQTCDYYCTWEEFKELANA